MWQHGAADHARHHDRFSFATTLSHAAGHNKVKARFHAAAGIGPAPSLQASVDDRAASRAAENLHAVGGARRALRQLAILKRIAPTAERSGISSSHLA
jgi:hypothetical protein